MHDQQAPLYGEDEAHCLREREARWEVENRRKAELLLANLGPCRRLVDIGCGWGQFLRVAEQHVPEVWGVDESPERLADIRQACPTAKVVICRAERLNLADRYFDVVVTSQMLHEVRIFGRPGELRTTLQEIHRVLVDGGRYLLLDHADAGEGEVLVRLPPAKIARLLEFEGKYRYYPATHEPVAEGVVRIPKRCLQDFLTKDMWLNTSMEPMEMSETHNVFEQAEITQLLEAAGFAVRRWIPFADISEELARAGGELLEGEPWFRKFLSVVEVRR